MKYKLIVLDLDGTLTNSKKEITPRNRETLIRIQEQGIRLVLASGRPTYGIVPLANELRMNEFGGFKIGRAAQHRCRICARRLHRFLNDRLAVQRYR